MSRRIARTVSGVLAGFGVAAVAGALGISAGVAAAEPATPTTTATTPAPGATSTVDELADMVLDALEHGPAKPGQ